MPSILSFKINTHFLFWVGCTTFFLASGIIVWDSFHEPRSSGTDVGQLLAVLIFIIVTIPTGVVFAVGASYAISHFIPLLYKNQQSLLTKPLPGSNFVYLALITIGTLVTFFSLVLLLLSSVK